jgi:hypothetical protein
MSSKGPDSKSSKHPGINPLIPAGLAAVGFIALLVIIIYLTQRLESVEDRLNYISPTPQTQTTAGIDITDSQTVYVPIYSHIYSKGGNPFLLEATLSIRNSDPERSIELTSVNYYDTKGKLIQEYLEGRLTLGPLETTAFLVEKADTRGGSGANFIVTWISDEPVYEPIIEAVMVGLDKGYSISFKSIGRPLAERAQPVQDAN